MKKNNSVFISWFHVVVNVYRFIPIAESVWSDPVKIGNERRVSCTHLVTTSVDTFRKILKWIIWFQWFLYLGL